jgi:hypothetical protein
MFSFGHFIVNWNHVEIAARDILGVLTGGNAAARIVTYQMGNASLTDALRVSSAWHPEAQEHLTHFAKFMDVVRAYRNYYIHNLIGVGQAEGEVVGLVVALETKGRYRLTEKALRLSDLDYIYQHCNELRRYGLALEELLKAENLEDRVRLASLLEKPSLPEVLAKTVHDPQAHPSQP